MTPTLCFHCMNAIAHRGEVCPHCGYDNQVRHNGASMLGETVLNGQYLVGHILGRGGFGITYIGYDLILERRVAIKEYFPGQIVGRNADNVTLTAHGGSESAFEKGCQRALKEGRMAASLGQIPGVVQIYSTFMANNTVYIVMEYIEGSTLTDYVANQPARLTLPEVVELLAPVAGALKELHRQKVIHRDVKPDNIMVRKIRKEGVLLDFGAARADDGKTLSNSSAVVSPGYAPPEQYNATTLDGRIDQYAFAATLYYTLTGKRPPDVMMRIADEDALPPIRSSNHAVPAAAETAIFKAMSIKAGQRYDTMDDFWEAVCAAAEGRKPGKKPAEKNAKQETNEKKKGAAGRVIAGLVCLMLAGAVGVFALGGFGKKPTEEPVVAVQATEVVTDAPTEVPTEEPTEAPTEVPTEIPTEEPTEVPTEAPTATPEPTEEPTEEPTATPTATPTVKPTEAPTPVPTATPVPVEIPKGLEENFEYVVLPDGGIEVTGYFGHRREMIVIPEGVTSIGKNVFAYGSRGSQAQWMSVEMPSTLEKIGDRAFCENNHLYGITIPEGVTEIEEYTFYGCQNLYEVMFPQTVTRIGKGAFQECIELAHVSFPEQLEYIGDYAFCATKEKLTADSLGNNMKKIVIPKNVRYIGKYAFSGSGYAKELIFDNCSPQIEDYAFANCVALKSISIPDFVTEWGNNPFLYCNKLATIKVEESHPTLEVVDKVLFDKRKKKLLWYPCGSRTTKYRIPEGTLSIGSRAFEYSIYLTEITIPDSVVEIGENPFAYCEKLEKINISPTHPTLEIVNGVLYSKADKRLIWYPQTLPKGECIIPEGTQSISSRAFAGCHNLTGITIPDSVTSIGERAFEKCDRLQNVVLPAKLTKIEEGTFYDCENLKNVTIPDGVTEIADYAFYGCSLENVIVPEGVTRIGRNSFSGNNFSKLQLPSNLEEIGEGAFSGCALKEITIPEKISHIEAWTFSYSSLIKVSLPDGLENIGGYAFHHCTSLEEVDMPKELKRIDAYAFRSCTALKEIELPEGLESIGTRAFYLCNELTLSIPESVKNIGTLVFSVDRSGGYIPLTIPSGSYAETYCKQHDIPYTLAD